MPAEAIHLSALDDSLTSHALAHAVGAGDRELRSLLRLGAVLIDLAYFDNFALGVAKYVLGRPLATAPIGDALHQKEPVRLAKHLLSAARMLRRTSRRDGDRLLAMALGFVSHIAVDSRLHPLVNCLARERATRLSDHPARQHNEVEKFHSVLFHEERLGFDFMGTPRIASYIAVDTSVLARGPLLAACTNAITAVHGSSPTSNDLMRWSRGYAQYGRLLASWFGARIFPAAQKAEVRAEVYDGFVDHYASAIDRSRRYLEAALAFVDDGDEAAFDRVIPEGSIDDPPYATAADRGE